MISRRNGESIKQRAGDLIEAMIKCKKVATTEATTNPRRDIAHVVVKTYSRLTFRRRETTFGKTSVFPGYFTDDDV